MSHYKHIVCGEKKISLVHSCSLNTAINFFKQEYPDTEISHTLTRDDTIYIFSTAGVSDEILRHDAIRETLDSIVKKVDEDDKIRLHVKRIMDFCRRYEKISSDLTLEMYTEINAKAVKHVKYLIENQDVVVLQDTMKELDDILLFTSSQMKKKRKEIEEENLKNEALLKEQLRLKKEKIRLEKEKQLDLIKKAEYNLNPSYLIAGTYAESGGYQNIVGKLCKRIYGNDLLSSTLVKLEDETEHLVRNDDLILQPYEGERG